LSYNHLIGVTGIEALKQKDTNVGHISKSMTLQRFSGSPQTIQIGLKSRIREAQYNPKGNPRVRNIVFFN